MFTKKYIDSEKSDLKLFARQVPASFNYIACFICITVILLVLKNVYDPRFGFTSLLRYGETFELHAFKEIKQAHRKIFPGNGFDGQFYANLSIDPALTHKNFNAVMDSPKYRSQRIFMPFCAYLAGHGNPALSINAYAVSNFAYWIGLCFLVFYKIRPRSFQEYACALMIIFSYGVIISAMLALTDMPSTVLLFAAISFPFIWPVLLCWAILTRETTVVFTLVFLIVEYFQKRKAMSIILKAAVAVMPVIIWYAYCSWRITEPAHLEKLQIFPLIYNFPFFSMIHRLGSIIWHLPQTLCLYQMQYFITALSLTLQCAYFTIHRKPTDALWLTGAIGALFFAILGRGPWMEWSWVLRMSLPMTFAFNFLLAKEERKTFFKWFPLGNIGCIYL